MTQDELSIQRLTTIPEDGQNLLPRFFAQLDTANKTEIFRRFLQLADSTPAVADVEEPIFYYALFLKCCLDYRLQRTSSKRKLAHDEAALTEARIKVFAVKKNKKAAPNRKFIAHHITLIETLLARNMSWRDISQFIKRHYRRTISYSYIRKVYADITETRKTW